MGGCEPRRPPAGLPTHASCAPDAGRWVRRPPGGACGAVPGGRRRRDGAGESGVAWRRWRRWRHRHSRCHGRARCWRCRGRARRGRPVGSPAGDIAAATAPAASGSRTWRGRSTPRAAATAMRGAACAVLASHFGAEGAAQGGIHSITDGRVCRGWYRGAAATWANAVHPRDGGGAGVGITLVRAAFVHLGWAGEAVGGEVWDAAAVGSRRPPPPDAMSRLADDNGASLRGGGGAGSGARLRPPPAGCRHDLAGAARGGHRRVHNNE